MKAKGLIRGVLLVFIAVSIANLAWKEVRSRQSSAGAPQAEPAASTAGPQLIAYYLHGKLRCVTCNDIEQTAQEAIAAGFPTELKDGRLAWRVVNYDEPGNEHFATDFQLAAPCVVLASQRDGRQVSWKSLPEVWELVGDKPAFREFVQQRVREQLATATDEPKVSSSDDAVRPASAVSSTPIPTSSGLPRLLDLGAGRCIPCKQMAPILEELRERYRGRLEVVVVDVGEDSDAAEKYNVSTIPTQIFYDREGTERFRHEGFFSKEEILAKWRELGVDLRSDMTSPQ